MSDWTQQSWLCLDTETTGIKPGPNKIVEIAATRFEAGEPVDTQSWLVNPGMPIPAEAQEVHGIGDAEVADCPPIAEVADALLARVRAADVLIAYNWPFDASFFDAELGEAWREAIAGKPVLDPLVVVRFDNVGRYWKGRGRHKLDAVATKLEIARSGAAHRAGSDCELTGRILWRLREHLPSDPYEAAARIERERQSQDENFRAWLARQQSSAPPG